MVITGDGFLFPLHNNLHASILEHLRSLIIKSLLYFSKSIHI